MPAGMLPRDAASITDAFLSGVLGVDVNVVGISTLEGGNLSEAFRVEIGCLRRDGDGAAVGGREAAMPRGGATAVLDQRRCLRQGGQLLSAAGAPRAGALAGGVRLPHGWLRVVRALRDRDGGPDGALDGLRPDRRPTGRGLRQAHRIAGRRAPRGVLEVTGPRRGVALAVGRPVRVQPGRAVALGPDERGRSSTCGKRCTGLTCWPTGRMWPL